MDTILSIDRSVFLFINHLPHSFPTNWIALLLSGVGTAGIVWFVLGALLIFKEEKKDHWFFVPLFVTGALSWIITEKLLKELIGRVRPTVEMGAILVGKPSLDPSFPSGHATIAFAMAVVLSHKEPRLRWLWYLLAILISLSRIYLGKHFPLDVIGGAVVGMCIGAGVLLVSSRYIPLRKKEN